MKAIITLAVASLIIGGVSLQAAPSAKVLWHKDCAKCHGVKGDGHTFMGRRFHIKDYTNPEIQKKLKDEDIIKALKDGVKQNGHLRMKPFGKVLNDKEIKEMVKYIRSLKRK